ncbi:alpha-2-macroglobulin [Fulvivirga sp. M361]|uniref:alpha-2-macroglobulin family protein n=1 Tax=Fulvivirga sp. M361 TaxID=2594266 RepID=UPI00117B1AE7|nr:MG2 domain-containing protein [Fulvivirga sp. M361]TRX60553.1 alpha-2-macroglobulin [Fulvivirga sp. M361]
MRCLIPLLLCIACASGAIAQKKKDYYSSKWLEVYRNEVNQLPTSALRIVDSIYTYARADQNEVQSIKALVYQSKFALILEEDAKLNVIQNFKTQIPNYSTVGQSILKNYIANMYLQYYQQNRWKIHNRTKTLTKVDSTDFRTWDAQTLLLEIHSYYQQSLKHWQGLRNKDQSSFYALIDRQSDKDTYRPTLLDLLVHDAIGFYKSDLKSVVPDKNTFALDSSYFGPFGTIQLADTIKLSEKSEVMKLYLRLLGYHEERKDIPALVALDLERLEYVLQNTSDCDSIYMHRLGQMASLYQDHPASTLIEFDMASYYFYHDNKAKALKLCISAEARYPESDGAAKCRELQAHILSPTLDITTEQYILPDAPSKIRVRYTNIDSLYFRAYRLSQPQKERLDTIRGDQKKIAFIKSLAWTDQWSAGLLDLYDYKEHDTEILVPALERGTYVIHCSTDKTFEKNDVPSAYGEVTATSAALIEAAVNGRQRFHLVDRATGKPLAGVQVHIQNERNDGTGRQLQEILTTDENGFCSFPLTQTSGYAVAQVLYNGDTVRFGNYYINRTYGQSTGNSDDYISVKPFLFTDRSIYRPGQTVYFKGILLQRVNDRSSLVTGKHIEVYLDDVNDEEVGFLRLKTNEFGSFKGQFEIPQQGLNGEYTLYADQDYEEDSTFYEDEIDDFEWAEYTLSVEEYKRPTFEVTIDPVKETFSINDSVKVYGKARSFSGSNISNAKIIYSVQRQTQYPYWYSYFSSKHYVSPEQIASGESTTDTEGNFSISFKAVPDPEVDPDNLPVFTYVIETDVLDISGETRSSSGKVKVGYHDLSASLAVNEQMDIRAKEVTLNHKITNLNNEPIAASGKVEIYQLSGPKTPLRERPWPAPDLPVITEATYARWFPHEPYQQPKDWKQWDKGDLQTTYVFDTNSGDTHTIKLDDRWKPGSYVAELVAIDTNGSEVTTKAFFRIFDSISNKVSHNELIDVKKDKASYRIGDQVKLSIGTASKDMTVVVEVDKNHTIRETKLIHLSEEVKEISIEVTGADTEGFAIQYYYVNYNSFGSGTLNIPVNTTRNKLEIETVTYRDKLMPGSEETWSFKIKGKKKERAAVEFLASMYDASLDQFRGHRWKFEPDPGNRYYSYRHNTGSNAFGTKRYTVKNLNYRYYNPPRYYYNRFNWFGFDLGNNKYKNRRYVTRLQLYDLEESVSTTKITIDKNKPSGYIYGTVTSTEDGSPLAAVNVIIKGTTTGAITDLDGHYTISAKEGDTLVFSFIGFSSIEANPGNRNVIDVQLAPDVQQLSEVVVTAYGEVLKKQSVGYAVANVEVVEEEAFNLAGRVAGVQILNEPGASPKIMIRGNSATNGSNPPMYVVDGKIVSESTLSSADVVSMEVLQADAATGLYGARAANGVVIITTRSGQKKMDEMLAQVKARSDLRETAFFYPQLKTNKKGEVSFNFVSPESLTRWKLQLLAHSKDLRVGYKSLQTVTQKKLMVVPNAPRFVRKKDQLVLSAKIVNLTNAPVQALANVQLYDADSGKEITGELLVLDQHKKTCNIREQGSNKVTWLLNIPERYDAIEYKIVATNGEYSDGERNVIPVLPNKQLVTETLPMTVKGNTTRQFSFKKLTDNTSSTLKNHRLTLEVTTNPIWYAIKSLPYLMEYPYECSEQTFARLYANLIASNIIAKYPVIKEVFSKWSSSEALVSKLEKNQELRSILIQETPWLREARDETEQQKRIALLFDLEKTSKEADATFQKLAQMQFSQGGFPWFSGSARPNRYITQHILSDLGHLDHIGIHPDFEGYDRLENAGISFMDHAIIKDHEWLLENSGNDGDLRKNNINNIQIQYLYARSFFTKQKPKELTSAYRYYLDQSAKYWTDFDLMGKAMIALVHHRAGNKDIPGKILKSLEETSINSDELGMYWKENRGGYYWNESAIETQSLIIEAFTEISGDTSDGERVHLMEMKNWLLKHKQVNKWSTTRSTTEAIYALLLNKGPDIKYNNEVKIKMGSVDIRPQEAEAGSGYYKQHWSKEEISNEMGNVAFSNEGNGMAWGNVYWQYFEEIDNISNAENTGLYLEKEVFKVLHDPNGEVLMAVSDSSKLQLGDLLRVRIELKSDRDMEFMHMKDQRASGLEPLNTLSQYKWQDGLGYYESVKDASTNFFFESLPKGIYVFEYDLRINNAGDFTNGITTIQNMYAPEISSHSRSIRLKLE